MIKKTQADVGKDFDAYAKKWQKVGYDLEIKGDHASFSGARRARRSSVLAMNGACSPICAMSMFNSTRNSTSLEAMCSKSAQARGG